MQVRFTRVVQAWNLHTRNAQDASSDVQIVTPADAPVQDGVMPKAVIDCAMEESQKQGQSHHHCNK